ncbi:MAG: hypothetical protein N2746_00820 [Deltaproteobacteria bacterium]|nr:hypothetical protein [Deltaproteobacteria bacterium]
MNGFRKVIQLCLLFIFLISIFSACAGPRLIVGSTGRQGAVKFIWDDKDEQGIIKCDVGAAGALSNCRNIKVELKE